MKTHAQLASEHADFLAPTFVVRLGSKDLVRDLAIGVTQVECDLVLNAPGRFSFTVVNAYDAKERDFFAGRGGRLLDLLKFGAGVEIALGYRDHANLAPVLSGVITEISTGFTETGSPELAIAGYDHLFPMMLGTRSESIKDSTDSDAVRKRATQHGLGADIESTREKHPQIEQNQESDLDFVKRLAQKNHFQFYVDTQRRLRFGPPRDAETAIATLAWGQGLLGFKPEANLSTQVSEVHVYGWDEQRKVPIVGKAVAGEEPGRDPSRKSGGEHLKQAIGKPVVLELRQPVFSAAEAKRRATAILSDYAKRYLTGDAECIGLPVLRPDRNVALSGLGSSFSKTYYIQQAVHKVDAGGYRTRLKVKEPSS